MTDEQIRQAFERWQADHNPTQYPAEREAFSDGWKAALASLERDCTDCIHVSLKASQAPCRSCSKEMIVFQNHEPLYRIKDKS